MSRFEVGEIYRNRSQPRLWAQVDQLIDDGRSAGISIYDAAWDLQREGERVTHAQFAEHWDLLPFRIAHRGDRNYEVTTHLPTGQPQRPLPFPTRKEAGRHIATWP